MQDATIPIHVLKRSRVVLSSDDSPGCHLYQLPAASSALAVWPSERPGLHRHLRRRCRERTHQARRAGKLCDHVIPLSLSSRNLRCVTDRPKASLLCQVFVLSGLESRKPPEKPPNWCTSYRLKCAGLVGVVQLGASHERLRPECSLQWGEIVAVSLRPGCGADQDFKERARGRMAVRLLNRGDLSILEQRPELLCVGTRVAVIDLRVFVPEVISVRCFGAVLWRGAMTYERIILGIIHML